MALLEIRALKKYYVLRRTFFAKSTRVIRALDDVSFEVDSGEAFGVVGESGSGKTSLGRCIVRLIDPDSGKILFNGQDLIPLTQKELKPVRRRIQMIFQDPYGSLNPAMSVSAIIEEPLRNYNVGTKLERQSRVEDLMNFVGLDIRFKRRYPHEFSAGQRQRIGIARAIALNPELIVADEPVSSLDVSVRAQIINLMRDLQEKLGLTMILIAHDLPVVQYVCNRIGVMYFGRLVEIARSVDLFRKPLHPYTRLLLGSVPSREPESRRTKPAIGGDVPSALDPPRGCKFHPRCPIAIDRCKNEEPEIREIESGHFAACHLPGS